MMETFNIGGVEVVGILTKNRMKTDIIQTASGEVIAKRCKGECGEIKLRVEMLKDSRNKDGMGTCCIDCHMFKFGNGKRVKGRRVREEVSKPYKADINGVEVVGLLTTNLAGKDIIQTASGEVLAKRCSGECNEMKLRADMSKKSRNKDGMGTCCKECNTIRIRESRKDPARRKKVNERQRKYDLENQKDHIFCEKHREIARESRKRAYKKDPTSIKISVANRNAMKRALPYTLTTEQYIQNASFFGGVCALSGEPLTTCELEHALPLIVGHGGTTAFNCYPLRSDLNTSKNDRNIFEWFEAHGERWGIRHDRFDNLISWLAANHGLSVSDYRSFYYWCFDNRRTVEEVEADPRPSVEIWKAAQKEAVPV